MVDLKAGHFLCYSHLDLLPHVLHTFLGGKVECHLHYSVRWGQIYGVHQSTPMGQICGDSNFFLNVLLLVDWLVIAFKINILA